MSQRSTSANGNPRTERETPIKIMEMPLFPLSNVVLFPGMALPLHIFEPRYREMIQRCLDEKLPFGVLLIKEGKEVGERAIPHLIGTAARISRVEKEPGGRLNIMAIGTQRFRVRTLHDTHSYLTGTVEAFPFLNGSTKIAAELAHKIRPRLIEYVQLLGEANDQKLSLDHLPEDANTLAFMVAIALQTGSKDKQALLELPGIPGLLAREIYMLSREALLLQYMVDTYRDIIAMNMGPTGYIFPN